MMNNMLKNNVNGIRDKLVKAYKNNEVYEYVSEFALRIDRDEEKNIEKVVFTIGGPFIYLDFEERLGTICGFSSPWDEGIFSAIPWDVWISIKQDVEDCFEEAD